MELKPNEVPVNDKGEQANLVLRFGNVLIPFWIASDRFTHLIPGERYLAVFTETKDGVGDNVWFMSSNRELDVVEWESIDLTIQTQNEKSGVIDVLHNDALSTTLKYTFREDLGEIIVAHDSDPEKASVVVNNKQ